MEFTSNKNIYIVENYQLEETGKQVNNIPVEPSLSHDTGHTITGIVVVLWWKRHHKQIELRTQIQFKTAERTNIEGEKK